MEPAFKDLEWWEQALVVFFCVIATPIAFIVIIILPLALLEGAATHVGEVRSCEQRAVTPQEHSDCRRYGP
jgi:hypothetical protein